MKSNYTMYIYKTDKRTKSGERLMSTTVWKDRDLAGMTREVAELGLPKGKFRVEFVPTMKTVTNMMTGKPVEIPHDTPRACDPSSELYWSM